MPKKKTHKGLAKRIKVTAKGKLRHHRSGSSHLLGKKGARRRRRLRQKTELTGGQEKIIRRLMGR